MLSKVELVNQLSAIASDPSVPRGQRTVHAIEALLEHIDSREVEVAFEEAIKDYDQYLPSMQAGEDHR